MKDNDALESTFTQYVNYFAYVHTDTAKKLLKTIIFKLSKEVYRDYLKSK